MFSLPVSAANIGANLRRACALANLPAGHVLLQECAISAGVLSITKFDLHSILKDVPLHGQSCRKNAIYCRRQQQDTRHD
ncbi:hypothetical protein [Ensifer canadensis]